MKLLKKIVFFHLIPATLAAFICWSFIKNKPVPTLDLKLSAQKIKTVNYVLNFSPFQLTEQAAFSVALKSRVPVLMGSSELTSTHLKGLAQNFFTKDSLNDRFLAFGHAGFQSLAMLTVLAANRQLLKDSKITIILSPGWFEEQYCKGTSLKSFFEYAPPNYMYQINSDKGMDEATRSHLENYVKEHFDQISRPDAILRLMAKKNGTYLNSVANAPFDFFNRLSLERKAEQDVYLISQKIMLEKLIDTKVNPYRFNKGSINWDSLMTAAKKEFKNISTNNTLSVENSYYDTWLRNKRKKRLIAVKKEDNQEFKDLKALVQFLKMAECKPLFVIMPLNTKAHEDLSVLEPIITDVKQLLSENNFKTLDMFLPNLRSYEEGVLEDIMHPYDLGWYQIDKFILENYKDGN